MATVSFLYEDMPVKITDEDCKKYRGLDLANELEGDSKEKITQFLDTVHQHVYDFLIFSTGDRRWKIKIIEKYKAEVEKTLKMALLVQAAYLLNNGNIEMFNGVIKTVNGVDIKDNTQINEKIIAPSIVNMLASTKPNLLFAGR
ncbi:MAG: hypothetical protein IJX16_07555 [Clostridia bacterium]|nr:hypothetical protein [Clostridia bacterium]MBQ8427594.1 hypothetical protein [Clostridia bacterium]